MSERILGQNLFVRSEGFDNTWAQLRLTSVGVDVVQGPLPGSLADSLVANAVNNLHNVSQVVLGAVGYRSALSVFAKAGAKSWLLLTQNAGAEGGWFNLATGVVGTSAAASLSIAAAPVAGWWRCTCIFNNPPNAAGSFELWPAEADTVTAFAGDAVSASIYLFGAQLVRGVSPNWSGQYIDTRVGGLDQGGNRNLIS